MYVRRSQLGDGTDGKIRPGQEAAVLKGAEGLSERTQATSSGVRGGGSTTEQPKKSAGL